MVIATVNFYVTLTASPFVLGSGAVGQRLAADGALVTLGAVLAQSVPTHEDEEVPAVLLRQQGVQTRVGARVEGVEEDEEDLGLGDGDKGVAQEGGEAEEGYGRPAGEIREDQQGHPFRDGQVATDGGRRPRAAP